MMRTVKPKTQRVKRALDARAPKVVENTKSALIVRGGNTSQAVTDVLRDLANFKKPDAVVLKRKNPFRPFEDSTPLEAFSKKYDASLFLYGSHSKKRPNTLIVGRMFDHLLMDMAELHLESEAIKVLRDFPGEKSSLGSKPLVVFAGDEWERSADLARLRSLLLDFFRGPTVDNVNLAGLDHVMQFSVLEGKVHVRIYRVILKKSGTRLPRVELEEMGPSLDMRLGRTKFASDDVMREALKQPKELRAKREKNVEYDGLKTKSGRIHMQAQDIGKLQTRKVKGLKRAAAEVSADADAAAGETTVPAHRSKRQRRTATQDMDL